MYSSLSTVISALNKVECDLPGGIICSHLNRTNCRATTGTCGACLEGHYGEKGDANSPCVPHSMIESLVTVQRTCPGNCSYDLNHGICHYFSAIENKNVSSCMIGQACNAKCECQSA